MISRITMPSLLTSYLQIFIVFFIINIYINNVHVSGNVIRDQTSDDNELFDLKYSQPEDIKLMQRGVWSRIFRNKINLPRQMNSDAYQSPAISGFTVKNGQIHLIPYDKRTIPLELRKALYAHGILGR